MRAIRAIYVLLCLFACREQVLVGREPPLAIGSESGIPDAGRDTGQESEQDDESEGSAGPGDIEDDQDDDAIEMTDGDD